MEKKKCFVLSPVGQEGSELSKYYNTFLESIIIPVCNEQGYEATRIENTDAMHLITRNELQLLLEADLVIADLSFLDPHVMYGLGVRHSIGKPTITLIKRGEVVPFDIYTVRVIVYDLYDLDGLATTRKQLSGSISHLEVSKENTSPIIDAKMINKLTSETELNNTKKGISTTEIESSLKTLIDRIGNLENSVKVIAKEVTMKSSVEHSRNIFIVHGHDGQLKNELARLLEKLRFNPIILHEQPDKGLTIIQKLQQESSKVGYSFILYTPDDEGKKIGDTEVVKPRSRQNVIFEHGLFVGKFHPERVCAILKADVEIPSDLTGVIYKRISEGSSINAIALDIIRELKAAGYKIDANEIL
jgi:predicted nucleotide-binding protein